MGRLVVASAQPRAAPGVDESVGTMELQGSFSALRPGLETAPLGPAWGRLGPGWVVAAARFRRKRRGAGGSRLSHDS